MGEEEKADSRKGRGGRGCHKIAEKKGHLGNDWKKVGKACRSRRRKKDNPLKEGEEGGENFHKPDWQKIKFAGLHRLPRRKASPSQQQQKRESCLLEGALGKKRRMQPGTSVQDSRSTSVLRERKGHQKRKGEDYSGSWREEKEKTRNYGIVRNRGKKCAHLYELGRKGETRKRLKDPSFLRRNVHRKPI